MALFATPEDHAANPPGTWQVVKDWERVWHLNTAAGVTLGSFKTKRDAEEHKRTGFYVDLYAKEGRWYAGKTPAGYRSWAEVKAERERTAARWPGHL
jgi:hypothetical protein